MEKEKFAYVFRFAFGDDDEILVRGTTSSTLVKKLSEVQEKINSLFGKNFNVVNVSFGSLNDLQNGPQTNQKN